MALCLAVPAFGEEAPLWEAGIGMAMLNLPDYRGSDEDRTHHLPIPYFVYRGDRLRVDRSGVHGDVTRTGGFVLDISANLGPPAESEKNTARTGMPDIDPTIEVGPSLEWLWYQNARRDRELTLKLPLRAVMTTGFEHIGWVFAPNINMDFFDLLGPGSGWSIGAAIGPIYASDKYHEYYYEVAPEFATATRPTYEASGGYSGSRATLSLSKRFRKFWFGAFVRYDSLNSATFEDSPLVRKDHSFMAGFGLSWIFARSEERVTIKSPSER